MDGGAAAAEAVRGDRTGDGGSGDGQMADTG